MRVHDVSLTLRSDMPTWPGESGPRVEPLKRMARGDSSNVSLLTFGDHTGTHVDPPVHFIEGAGGMDTVPLDALVGPCRVVAYDGDGPIGASWLESAGIDRERVLFKTRNSVRWADPSAPFDQRFVALEASGGEWLVRRGTKLVGIDYLSIEPFGSGRLGHPVHVALLQARVAIVEGVDLHEVEPGLYDLVCAPLKIKDGTGGPARVFLIER